MTHEEKLLAALSYVGVLCVLPVLLKKDSTFAMHHARQGIVILIAWVLLWIGAATVPLLGGVVWFFGSIVLFVLSAVGVIRAASGDPWELPWLGDYAKRIQF
jgi:uncharacterized membrane protein